MAKPEIAKLPKAELHAHLEGTIAPAMAKKLAKKNGIDLPDDLFTDDGTGYRWDSDGTAAGDLVGFLKAYDKVAALIKTADDYRDITCDYLKRCAAEGSIYEELIISADHGASVGLSYQEMVDAIAAGVYQAREKTGIEARLLSACVRHYGPDNAVKVAQQTVDYPHELVTAFHMAGDENAHTVTDFAPAFKIASDAGLATSAHAGEAAGPKSIRDVKEQLGCIRYGHMVRIIEDEDLMKEMQKFGAVPEVCVSSNLVMNVFQDYASHPLRKLFDEGFKVTLGSDDPPFFKTTIGKEYKIAAEKFGFTAEELLQVTRNAVEAAFVDEATREKLLKKIDDYAADMKAVPSAGNAAQPGNRENRR
jgi:adenosine deaminase